MRAAQQAYPGFVTDGAPGMPDPETLRFVYEHIRAVPREQQRTGDSLDDKVIKCLTAGGVVLGFSAVTTLGDAGAWVVGFAIAALAVFGLLTAVAIAQLRPVDYRITDDRGAWESQWDQTPVDAMQAIVTDTAESYSVNDDLNKAKAEGVRRALLLLAVEVALVGLSAVASAF